MDTRLRKWAIASFPKTLEAITHIHSTLSQVPDPSVSTLYLVSHLVITASPPDPSGVNRHMTHEAEPAPLYFLPGLSQLEEQWGGKEIRSSCHTVSLIGLDPSDVFSNK